MLWSNNEQGAEFLRSPLHIEPTRASQSAIKAIEALGGSVKCTYYNPLALRDLVRGRTDRKRAAPTRKSDIGECKESYVWTETDVTDRVVLELEESGVFGDAADAGGGEGSEKGGVCWTWAAGTSEHRPRDVKAHVQKTGVTGVYECCGVLCLFKGGKDSRFEHQPRRVYHRLPSTTSWEQVAQSARTAANH
jgi:hypothetical protein